MKIFKELMEHQIFSWKTIFYMFYGEQFGVSGPKVTKRLDFSSFSEEARKEFFEFIERNDADISGKSFILTEFLAKLEEKLVDEDYDWERRKLLFKELSLWRKWCRNVANYPRLNQACFLLIYFDKNLIYKNSCVDHFVKVAENFDLATRKETVSNLLASYWDSSYYPNRCLIVYCEAMKGYCGFLGSGKSSLVTKKDIKNELIAFFTELALWQEWAKICYSWNISSCEKSLVELLRSIIEKEEISLFKEMLKQSGFILPKRVAKELTTFVENAKFKKKGAKLQFLQVISEYL